MDLRPDLRKGHSEPWGVAMATAELMSLCGSVHVLLPHRNFLGSLYCAKQRLLRIGTRTEMMLDQQQNPQNFAGLFDRLADHNTARHYDALGLSLHAFIRLLKLLSHHCHLG